MRDVAPGSAVVVPDERDAQIEELARRLADAEAALQAMISGQVDAVADPRTTAPVLLHEAQDALRRSEERYRDLVSKSPAIVCELAPDGTTLFVNDRITTILGYSASDLIGKDWWAALAPDQQRTRATALWRYLLQGNTSELEIAVVAVDGSQRRIEWNCANRYGPKGALESVVAFGIDITERKRVEETGQRLAAEQAARAEAEGAELRAQLLAEASRVLSSSLDYEATLARVADLVVPTLGDWCAIDMVADDGTVRRLAAHHSSPARVLAAAGLRDQYPPDPASARGVPNVLRTGEAELYPDIAELLIATARDEKHLDLLGSLGLRSAIIVPVKARERTIGAITLASAESGRRYDETDLRVAEDLAYRAGVAVESSRLYREAQAARGDAERARADAEQANKAKSEFLASMSHELRTPLNAIGGYVQLLWEGLPGPINEKQRDYLSRVRRSQAHLLGLINNVLNFAKLEAGQLQYEIGAVRLRESLGEVDDLIAPQVRAKGLRYDIQICESDVVMRADRAKVRQILLNLVSNAVKFTAPGGDIAIDCGVNGSHAFIEVRDTGTGIAPDRLGDVFEPFVQLEKGASREGTGLGLSISRELARAMQGDLTVESELGKGSAFKLTLPVVADAPTSDAASGEGDRPAT